MKRLLSIFLCVVLTLSISVFNSSALDFDMDAGEMNDADITYKISDIDGKYKTQGRTTVIDGTLMLDHSASGIEFSAKCKGAVAVTFNTEYLNSTDENGGCYFTVIIDGEEKSRNLCHITEVGTRTILLETDLKYGMHTFEIYRQTELAKATIGIKSIILDGKLLNAEKSGNLHIEFLGDSVTAGSGVLGDSSIERKFASTPKYQDATKGFAYLTAKKMDADFSVIAQSGIGVSVGHSTDTMLGIYPKLRYGKDSGSEYDFSRKADVVVVALGSNDISTYEANNKTLEQVKQGYIDLLELVKAKNPNAAIVWVYNMMDNNANSLISQVIEEKGGQASGYYALKLTRNNSGVNSHPYYTAQAVMADELAEFIKQNVFWDNKVANFGEFKGNSIRTKSELGEQGLRFKYNVNTDSTDVYEKIVDGGYDVEEIGVLAIRTRYLNDEALIKNGVYGTKSASCGVLYNKASGYNKISSLGTGSAVLINIGYNTKNQTLDYNAYSDDYTTRLYMKLKNGDRNIIVYDEEETASVFEVMQEIIKLSDAENPSEQATIDRQSVDTLLQNENADKNSKTLSQLYCAYQTNAETWLSYELDFISDKEYTDTVYTTNMDVIFFNQTTGKTFTVPAFWNGGVNWKARFALQETGDWRYVTRCSDRSNKGLHYVTGSIKCSEYSGDLDIYKNGFVKVEEGKKYFTYDNGEPFFYLGDTHWTLPMEDLEGNGGLTDSEISAFVTKYSDKGLTAEALNSKSQFEFIMDYRASQGFTVIQSQQLATYNAKRTGTGYHFAGNSWLGDETGNIFSRGIDSGMLEKFNILDKYFDYIADLGLVHSHTQFAYPDLLFCEYFHFSNIDDEQLESLCRYWVARYSSYPVIWATSQEADDSYYKYHTPNAAKEENRCYRCNVDFNPWEMVMDMISEYDPYNHPSTAHMQSTIQIDDSSFDDYESHDFYAAQYLGVHLEQAQGGMGTWDTFKLNWNNSKPVVNYEGFYDNYQCSPLRARAQGWTAYLNGMFGYGYGTQPIWSLYWSKSTPSTYATYYKGSVNWVDGVYATAADGLSIMKNFFTHTLKETYGANWWELLPCFDGNDYYDMPTINNDKKYSLATFDKNKDGTMDIYMGYFAGTEKRNLGTFKSMKKGNYKYEWYDCRTGGKVKTYNITVGSSGSYRVADGGFFGEDLEKPDATNKVSGDSNYNDMFLVVTPR